MKTAGIIAEYNPFHNGHQYHIKETRKQTGADYIIAVMSGDFVQRGAPALMDKYDRAYCALAGGCDLVLELPVIYSSASAEYFAAGSIRMLNRLGICDYLSFGSEDGSLDTLTILADILSKEPLFYQEALRKHLKSGLSFPASREKALEEYIKEQNPCRNIEDFSSFLKGSNNILALEYLKILNKTSSSIKPFTVLRKNANYHDTHLYNGISSASAIRHHAIHQDDLEPIRAAVPEETYHYMEELHKNNGSYPDFDSLTPYLHSILLRKQNFSQYMDWDQELSNRLARLNWPLMSYSKIADALKSKNTTHSRIHRALLHLILGIKQADFQLQYDRNPIPYAKILGFRKESTLLLRHMKNHSSIPLITKPADITRAIHGADSWVWEKDLTAARLYQSIQTLEQKRILPSPYERSPIIY